MEITSSDVDRGAHQITGAADQPTLFILCLLCSGAESNIPDKDEDLKEIKSLIARSGSKMSPQEKAELIAIIANSIK